MIAKSKYVELNKLSALFEIWLEFEEKYTQDSSHKARILSGDDSEDIKKYIDELRNNEVERIINQDFENVTSEAFDEKRWKSVLTKVNLPNTRPKWNLNFHRNPE